MLRHGSTGHRIVTHVATRLATAATHAAAGEARDLLPQDAKLVTLLRHPLLRQESALFCPWPQRALSDDLTHNRHMRPHTPTPTSTTPYNQTRLDGPLKHRHRHLKLRYVVIE